MSFEQFGQFYSVAGLTQNCSNFEYKRKNSILFLGLIGQRNLIYAHLIQYNFLHRYIH